MSIVIPAFNAARFVAEAIDSVLGQDYPHVELVVVDDGSTDATFEILQASAGRAILDRQPNRGQAAAQNRGWQRSSGAILSYLSADDVLRPNAVSTAVSALGRRPDAVLVYGDYELIDGDGRSLGTVPAREYDRQALMVELVCAPGPGPFFRRAAFEAAGPWNEQVRLMPDLEFWLRLGLQGPFCRVPGVLGAHRTHAGSMTRRSAPATQCDEAVAVTAGFYDSAELDPEIGAQRSRALANAHIICARYHLRSHRFGAAARHIGHAVALQPSIGLRTRTLRLLAGGLAR